MGITQGIPPFKMKIGNPKEGITSFAGLPIALETIKTSDFVKKNLKTKK